MSLRPCLLSVRATNIYSFANGFSDTAQLHHCLSPAPLVEQTPLVTTEHVTDTDEAQAPDNPGGEG